MTDNDNISKLYKAFSEVYDNFKSEDELRDYINKADDEKIQKLYNAFNDEYDNFENDFDGFKAYVGYGAAKPEGEPSGTVAGTASDGQQWGGMPIGMQTQPGGMLNPSNVQPYQPRQNPQQVYSQADGTDGTPVYPNPGTSQQEKQQKAAPLGPEKFAKQMQTEDALRTRQKDFSQRMENIRKGNQPFSTGKVQRVNNETGKVEDVYLTKGGDEVATPFEQTQANREYDQQAQTRKDIETLSTRLDAMLDDASNRALEQFSNSEEVKTLTDKNAPLIKRIFAASIFTNNNRYVSQMITPEVQNIKAAQRAVNNAKSIIKEADRHAQLGDYDNWFRGVGRGVAKNAGKVENWDFGLSSLIDNAAVLEALNKADNGEQLTESEQALLDATIIEIAANNYFGSEVSRGYKAGQVTAESLPFMLEMFINPASGMGRGVSGKVARYALKRFGKEAVAKGGKKYATATAMKIGGRLLGDVAGATTMTATTGQMGTIADAFERVNDAKMNGKELDLGKAYAQAFKSRTIENYSEMLGDYFSPAVKIAGKGINGLSLTKFGKKVRLDKVMNFVEDVSSNDLAKIITDFEQHAQWHGTIGEYVEEVAGNVLNGIFVGDMTFDTDKDTGIFNLDNNIDTFLGVAVLGGLFSGVKTVGYGAQKINGYISKYDARKRMDASEMAARSAFGDDSSWEAIRQTLAEGNVGEVKSVLEDVFNNPDYSEEQKRSVFDYAEKATAFKGVLMSEQKRRNSADANDEEVAAEQSYDRGYDADEGTRRDIFTEFGMAQEGDSDYSEKKAAWDGVVARINDKADEQMAIEREQGLKMKNPDGNIRPVTLKEKDEDGNDKEAFIIDGNVVMMSDGTMVDSEASDTMVVIYDPATGEKHQIPPSSILSVGEPTSWEDYDYELQRRRDEYVQKAMDDAQGTVRVELGQQLTMPDGRQGVVTALSPDGERFTVVAEDGSDQVEMKRSDLQQVYDEYVMTDYQERHQEEAVDAELPTLTEGHVQGAPTEFLPDMEITIVDDEGNEQPATIIRPVRYNRGKFVTDAKGDIVEYMVGNEVKHDWIEDLSKKVVSFVQEEPSAATSEEQQPVGATAGTVAEQPAGDINVGQTFDIIDDEGEHRNVTVKKVNGEDLVVNIDGYGEMSATKDDIEYYRRMASGTVAEQTAEEPQGEVSLEEQPAVDVMPIREDGEADYMATTPERGHQYIYNEAGLSREEAGQFVKANIDAAEKELKKLQGKSPKMGTSITKYQQEKAALQQQIDIAQRVVDYWDGVKAVQQGIVNAEAAEREERDRIAHEAAVLAEQQRQAEELAKQQEQAQRGANAVHTSIREKWDAAPKVEGVENEITLANGETVKGRYMLVESGAATPSHNPNMEFARNEGFPVDENGQTVNDRDYERDQEAQTITRQMGSSYDSRAIQTVPVVSNDGVVLSGNGRTMAGEIAAQQGTDAAYIEHLKKYPQQFGFTTEQVESMQHPRVVFVPDEAMPYTTDTFAKFNAQDMKSQSRTEQAVKLGKTVDDNTFGRIVSSINSFSTLGDFYNDPKASADAIGELHNAGVINSMQIAEMMDGEKISGVGRQMLENMLIGKAFEGNPDAIRQLSEYPSMRQSVVSALAEIANNIKLGEEYALASELSQAIDLAYQARKSGIGAGEKVSGFARQGNLFAFDEGDTVADYTNLTVMMLADCINDSRVSQLKKVLALYNDKAASSAAGQFDMFSGGIMTKEEIIKDVLNILNYGTEQEQQSALAGAAERRQATAGIQEDGASVTSGAGSGTGNNDRQGSNGGTTKRGESESNDVDENGYNFVKNEDGSTVFGEVREESGLPAAPIKLSEGYQDGNGKGYGLAHIEANHGKQIREAGFASVEDFVRYVAQNYDEDNIRVGKHRVNGSTSYLIQVTDEHDNTLFIELSKDNSYWNVNSGGIFRKGYSNKKETVAKTEPQQPNNVVSDGSSLLEETGNDIVPSKPNGEPTVSSGKDTKISETDKEKVANGSVSADDIVANKGEVVRSFLVEEANIPGKVKDKQGLLDAAVWSYNQALLKLRWPEVMTYEKFEKQYTDDNGTLAKYDIEYLPNLYEYISSKTQRIIDERRVAEAIESASSEVDTNPTEAQKKAGNYKMGHVTVDGYNITIENPKGSVRRGTDPNGKAWEQEMHNTYGYIRGTEGVDGDHIDVFLSDDPTQGDVFVVDQVDPSTGKFDEHKVMYGFADVEAAKEAYLSNYEEGWKGLGEITHVSKEEFKKWVDSSHRKTKPFSEYKGVKPVEPAGDAAGTVAGTVSSGGAEPTPQDAREWLNAKYDGQAKPTDGGHAVAWIDDLSDEDALVMYRAETLGSDPSKTEDDAFEVFQYFDSLAEGDTPSESAIPILEKYGYKGREVSKKQKAEGGVAEASAEQQMLVEGLVDLFNGMGIEATLDVEKGQRVLDGNAGGVTLSKGKKRALETAHISDKQKRNPADISNADGAKILKNLDILIEKLKNASNRRKDFLDIVSSALDAKSDGSKSTYASFVTKNGSEVTIRLSNHNASVASFDHHGEDSGISIVVSPKQNTGIVNDGKAYVIEYFYKESDLRKSEGKPLAEIVSSIKQALYSGEYKDTTGLAEREEVNADDIKLMKAWHGSAAVFDAFDSSHFLEGEGSMVYGAGHYVTDVEETGRMYADVATSRRQKSREPVVEWKGELVDFSDANPLRMAYDVVDSSRTIAEARANAERYMDMAEEADMKQKWANVLDILKQSKKSDFKKVPVKGNRQLYEVEIPDDNGNNYLDWNQGSTSLSDDFWVKIANIARRNNITIFKDILSVGLTDAEKLELTDEDYVELYFNEDDRNWSVGEIYNYFVKLGINSEKISKELNKEGYVGIKVPTGNNQGGDGRGMNYVIFNDSDLKIKNRISFHKADESAPVYYSNAYRAVEGIKQEKSTPEQWLAMLQKNGGLKAGEDKWIGLSDWLNAQRKSAENGGSKTLTKQEVLEYIAENQIQIEEVRYDENSVDELQKEYDELIVENGGDWEHAWAEMVERYGEELDLAADGTGGKISINSGFEDYTETINGKRKINDIRLKYTTKGLENKREIALVVPNVAPYKESDEVHFGDAGNGRAVAWVRFGDADARDFGGSRVLVIDEIQSNRHQDGREYGYESQSARKQFEKLSNI